LPRSSSSRSPARAAAKGLGGGLPIAGITARADIVDQVHAGGLGGTFGGNPLSCAAALAAMETIELVGPDGHTPDAELTRAIASRCHQEGVLVLTAGSYGNVLRFLPPLVISDDLLDDALGVLEKAISASA
jgi:4-aminobutyrate aminotransferase/(S)-3-amino-2-methylpropionate transaminase